ANAACPGDSERPRSRRIPPRPIRPILRNLSRRRRPVTTSRQVVEQALRQLLQPPQDVRSCRVDRADREPQLAGHLRGGGPLQRRAAAGAHGGRFELPLGQLEQAAEHVPVVLLIPVAVQRAVGVLEQGEGGRGRVVSGGGGPAGRRLPVIATGVGGDRAQPGAEGPAAARVAERRQATNDRQEDLLLQVVSLPSGTDWRCSQPTISGRYSSQRSSQAPASPAWA